MAARDGLTRIKDGHLRKFVPPDPQGRKRVYEALEGGDGRIWLALPSGLGEMQGERFRTVIASGPVMLDSSFVTLRTDRMVRSGLAPSARAYGMSAQRHSALYHCGRSG